MTIIEDIAPDASEFRRAVNVRQAYRPVYVKIKIRTLPKANNLREGFYVIDRDGGSTNLQEQTCLN